MAWDLRKTYYYIVCLVTLLLSMYGGVQVVQDALDLAWPEEPYRVTALDVWQRAQRPGVAGEDDVPFSREELQQMVEEQHVEEARRMRRRALRDLIGHLVLLGVAVPVYAYHWRHVRRL